jgi:nitronate monooxygenase
MGTRFTATVEAPIHQGIKEAMIANDERATDLIFRSYRNTARVAKNDISQQVVTAEREGQPFEAVADLVKGVRGREGLVNGDANHGIWSAGMVQGLIHDIPTCQELLSRMVADAEAIIRSRLGGMLVT